MKVEVYLKPVSDFGDTLSRIFIDGKEWENISGISWEASITELTKVTITVDAQLRIIEESGR